MPDCKEVTEKIRREILKVVLIPRVELGTSPLPRVRSTN